MDHQQIYYIEKQLEKVCPLPVREGANGQIKVKLHSNRGESNWLNITADQFNKIEDILLGVK